MKLSQTQQGRACVVAVSGRVDHGNAEALRAALQPALQEPMTVLDLSRLDYISSAGLRILMLAARETKARGHALAVCSLQPVVREIFAITRFDQVLSVHADVPAALRALGGA